MWLPVEGKSAITIAGYQQKPGTGFGRDIH